MAALSVIYTSMVGYTQELRATVERITIWGCGMVFIIDGWLVSRGNAIGARERLVSSLGIALFAGVFIAIVASLKRRFDGFAQVIRRVNEAQRVHEPGAYLADVPLFPEHWKRYGSRRWREPIFVVAYISLVVVTAFGIVAAWLL